ncbi:hypothetical protein Trydic_g3865 [Trypoxylus dichotomus]
MKLIGTVVFVIICLVASTVGSLRIDDEYHDHKLARIHRIRKQTDKPVEEKADQPIPEKEEPAQTLRQVRDAPQNDTNPNSEVKPAENVRQSRDTEEIGKEEPKSTETDAKGNPEAPKVFRKLKAVPSEEGSGSVPEGKSFRRIRDLNLDFAQNDELPAKEEARAFNRNLRDVPAGSDKANTEAQEQEAPKSLKKSRDAPAEQKQSDPNAQPQQQGNQPQNQEAPPQVQALKKARQTAAGQENQEPVKEEAQAQEQPKTLRKYRQAEPPKQDSESQEQPKTLRTPGQAAHEEAQPQERKSRQTPPGAEETQSKEAPQAQDQPKSLRKHRQSNEGVLDQSQHQEQSKSLRKTRQEGKPEEQASPANQSQALRQSRQTSPENQANPEAPKDETPKQEQSSALRKIREETKIESQEPQSKPQSPAKSHREARQTELVNQKVQEKIALRNRRDDAEAPNKEAPPVPAPQVQAQAIRKARQDDKKGTLESTGNSDDILSPKESEQPSSLHRIVRGMSVQGGDFKAVSVERRDTVDISFIEDLTNNNDHYYKMIESRVVRSDDEALPQQTPPKEAETAGRFLRGVMKEIPAENGEKKTGITDETIDLVRMLRQALLGANDEEKPKDLEQRSIIVDDNEHGDGHESRSYF